MESNMTKLNKTTFSLVLAGVLVSTAAFSQTRVASSQPNWRADALFETVTLSEGFTPDPWSFDLQAGGQNQATRLGDECSGYINNSAPDVTLIYEQSDGGQYDI